MTDLRDKYGNPIQLTDQYGNPVQLTDEFGNPMHLSGVADLGAGDIVGGLQNTSSAGVIGGRDDPVSFPAATTTPVTDTGVVVTGDEQQGQLHRSTSSSSSSSSSSSEEDGDGGRRKKGLKEKIKEKFGKHKDNKDPSDAKGDTTTTVPAAGQQHQEHEKKGFMEKMKEKLPGHHHSNA